MINANAVSFIALIFGVTFGAGYSVAAETIQKETEVSVSFQKADLNSDGSISREEARVKPGLSEYFDAADTNGDGVLDAAELKARKDGAKTH